MESVSDDVSRTGFGIRRMTAEDVEAVAHAFAHFGKTRAQYERYFAEQGRGERVTLVAVAAGGRVVGYANVIWQSAYPHFRREGVPEINDLNVVERARRRGVGTALIRAAESVVAARGHRVIGIGVGLTPDYAAAQRLYPKLGYASDGRGVHSAPPWDDAVYLTKTLAA
jgi:GNAT superfamily N-acetyltransferase